MQSNGNLVLYLGVALLLMTLLLVHQHFVLLKATSPSIEQITQQTREVMESQKVEEAHKPTT